MNHVFIDVEAFRLKQPWKAPLLNVAAVLFGATGAVRSTIDIYIEPSSWPNWVEPEQSTIDWWKEQDMYETLMESVRIQGIDCKEALQKLAAAYIGWGGEAVWFAGPTYDQVMLEAYFNNFGIPIPWKYNASRDFRTIRKQYPELLEMMSAPTTKHLALSDCLFDVERLRRISEATGRQWK